MDLSTSKKVAIRLGKQKFHLKTIKTQQPECQPQVTLKPEPSFDASGSLSTSTSVSKGLVKSESVEKPLFVLADWATRFLPTLYHVVFCSEKPFHKFSKGSAFAATVQTVLDIIHPGNTYVVTTTCKIYTMVKYLFFSA